ncbi:MAG TPA: DegT/DnrJ/EryC1/StrS family aminotransferase [Candidatus Angelobacter sp.]
MKVPFADLRSLHVPLRAELSEVFQRVLDNNSFILGPEVARFEEAFARYIGVGHCIAVSNGTVALQMALMALDIGPGDEVITAVNTFIATAEAISAVGARPVFVDVDPQFYNIDIAAVEKAITPRTKAIIPVHLYGQTADMDPLLALAEKHGLTIVEDACQAHGAEYKGRRAGSMGRMSCFSFYPGKNLGALGEGGAVLCNDAKLAQRLRMLRDHGSVKKYEHVFAGYNFRMEGLQGGFLAVKLPHLDKGNEGRRSAAAIYGRLLADSGVVTPAAMAGSKHIYHLYVIQTDDRDGLKQRLAEQGIETGLHYPVPLHLQQAYEHLGYKNGDFPVAESMAKRILSLPMFPTITQEQVEYVCSAVMEFVQCPTVKA